MDLFLAIVLSGIAGIGIGMLVGADVERKKQQAQQRPAKRRRSVCYYYHNQVVWTLGRPMHEHMMVSLTPGGEALEVHLDTHYYVIDPKTSERVWLIYG